MTCFPITRTSAGQASPGWDIQSEGNNEDGEGRCVLTDLNRKVPTALADHVEKNGLQGKLKYNLFVGASSGAETENRWARLNMIERRAPHQVGKEIAKGINNGNIKFFDKHLSMFPVDLMYGFYTKHKANNRLDVAIVEASAITEDGGIIPGASVGASPEIIQMADKVGRRITKGSA